MALSPELEAVLADHQRRAAPVVERIRAVFERDPHAWRPTLPVEDLATDPDLNRSTIIALFHEATTVRQAAQSRPTGILARLFAKANANAPIREYSSMPAGSRAIGIVKTLGKRKPAYTRADAAILLDGLNRVLEGHNPQEEWLLIDFVTQPLAAAERVVKEGGSGELRAPVTRAAELLGQFTGYSIADASKARARLFSLLDEDEEVVIGAGLIVPGDTWGEKWRTRVKELGPKLKALVVHLPLASSVVPTNGWRKRTKALLTVGAGEMLREMLEDAITSRSTQSPSYARFGDETLEIPGDAIVNPNVVVLRGAIWAAAALDEPWAGQLLGEVGTWFGTGSGNIAREERLAGSAANALGEVGTPTAIAGLGKMKAKVTNKNVSKQIAKALAAASARAGISPGELLELAVPTAGLDAGGTRVEPIAGWTATFSIEGDDAKLLWRGPDGKESSKPPAALVAADKAAVDRVKAELKELQKTLGIERGRVEELLVEDRDWPIETWRERYLGHPLTRSIASRLIWRFSTGAAGATSTAIATATGFETADGAQLQPAAGARVRLWHPIDATEDEVVAWRRFLMRHELRQPFKQAFREIYVATAAEDETSLYSNRFAGHILRYPQARALMTARRWASNFLGPFDGGQTGLAKREFTSHGIRAEFWHDALNEDGQDVDLTFENCTTDQVRFLRTGRDEAVLAIREVPPRVFSEAMRDVDVFVSVTSVGADRNWRDAGLNRQGRFDYYFDRYSNAELSGSADVRRAVLADLVPGLAIADRLELADRWLRVRGDRRTYRIHIGSGNILMEPSDRYLCIVPSRKGADQVFLPFDDDPTLSLILSKAFLLAADTRITDPTILSQIR